MTPNSNGHVSVRNRREDFVQVGPEAIAGRYLRRFWHPVYLSERLEPGRPKTVRMLGEDFTLYRGASGAAHAVGARCAHRGTLLSAGWVEDDCIRCFYHGWKYDASGRCVEQQAEDPGFAAKVRLRTYPTQEYLGLVFLYFGEGDAPELPRFPEMENETQGVRETYTYSWPCSYFNALENDSFHGIWVHRESYEAAGRVGVPLVSCEETEYGFVSRRILPEQATRWQESQIHFLMPLCNFATRTAPDLGGDAWRDALTWRVPVDDEHFATYGFQMTHVQGEGRKRYKERIVRREEARKALTPPETLGEAVLHNELRIEDVADRYADNGRLFNLQDYVAQVGQGTFGCLNDEMLGREDVEVIMLRTLYRREFQALERGQQVTDWRRPERLSVHLERAAVAE